MLSQLPIDDFDEQVALLARPTSADEEGRLLSPSLEVRIDDAHSLVLALAY